jgi:hypothetical protein
MAKVQIYLDKDESLEEAEKALSKALNFHDSGQAHQENAFADPAMENLVQEFNKAFEASYAQLLAEISEELEKEYRSGNV